MSIEGLKKSGWLNGPAWLQTDEEKWAKPWCQVSEIEAEQATSTVATETDLEKLFDWTRYSTFNRIRNFIAYCMRFKTKQNVPSKKRKSIKQNKYYFDLFKPKASRMFRSRSFNDLSMYSTFNRIRNFIAYCMMFKTKQNIPSKRENPSSRTNTVSNCLCRKLPECFEVDSK